MQAMPTYWRVFGRRNRVAVIRAETQAEFDAAVSALRWKPMGRERAKVHQCSVCGQFGPWGESWSWYGSYRDIEEHDAASAPIVKACSNTCRIDSKRRKLVPRNATFIDD